MARPDINEFYDINKLPNEPGITVLGISIPKIVGDQKPSVCLEASRHIISKINKPNVGAVVVYSDGLYMYDDKPAHLLKIKHQKLIEDHKSGYLKLLEKEKPFIPKAFAFQTWNQLMLDTSHFNKRLLELRRIFDADQQYQIYVQQDIEQSGREVTELTIGYILEETLLDYLVAKGESKLPNEYVDGHEKWVLHLYHGKPHRGSVYLHQKNFFDLNNENSVYQNCFYDLKNKKLYDYNRLDINSFDF